MDHTFEFGLVVKDRITFTSFGVRLHRGEKLHSLSWPSLRGIAVDRVVAQRTYRRIIFVGREDEGETVQMLHVKIAESDDELRRLEAFVRENHPRRWLGECGPHHARRAAPAARPTRTARAMVALLALFIALVLAAIPTLFRDTIESMPSHIPTYRTSG
jgi:hypothetical protein